MAFNAERFDHSSHEGATLLAEQIVEFWRDRGYVVSFELVCDRRRGVMSPEVKESPMWHVRTDLVGGLPRERRASV